MLWNSRFIIFAFALIATCICVHVDGNAEVVSDNFENPVEMYLYAWPLVFSSLTRQSMAYLPDNLLVPLPTFPDPNLTAIVKPNVDTLYSACWINHEKSDELVLTVPNTNKGVYYLFPLMDAWTNVVESPGWRTTGKDAITVLIQGPFSNQSYSPDKYDLIIKSTTSIAYLLGRTNVIDPDNLTPTQSQMFSYELNTIKSSIRNAALKSANGVVDIDKKTPVEKIFAMSAKQFFEKFAELMISNPPVLPQDTDIVEKMNLDFGLVPGQPWQFSDLDEKQKQALTDAVKTGTDLLYSYPVTKANGWTIPDMLTGKFGTNYYLRAYIGLVLYAANVPQDAVYFVSDLKENAGKVYELEFDPTSGGPPPTNQFWSVTMYSEDGYLVANENRTYSISSQQKLVYREDGRVHITVSMVEPADRSTTNWLPAPQAGERFQLTLRVYWPKDEVLSGTWTPPEIKEVALG